MGLNQNTWMLDEWYAQEYANPATYSGAHELWIWGRNTTGQLGLNQQNAANKSRSSPTQLPGTTWTTPIVGGSNANSGIYSCLKSDGTLWSWGYNEMGEMGQNSLNNGYSSPVRVGGASDGWAGGCINANSQFIVKTDGTMWTWGANGHGKLGHNNQTNYSSPRQLPGTTYTGAMGKVAAGGNGAMTLIKTDGTMWVWGRNDEGGEVGDANNVSRSSPVQVPGSWSKCARGSNQGMAINTAGELYTWGRNNTGGLGQSNNTPVSYPVKVGTATNWADISCSSSSGYGIKTDGTFWAWGGNPVGELGLNNRTPYNYPIQIPGTDWTQLSRGAYFSMGAIRTDGTLWVWGHNYYGELGQNQAYEAPASDPGARKSSPTQIPGTNWKQVASNGNNFIAIKEL